MSKKRGWKYEIDLADYKRESYARKLKRLAETPSVRSTKPRTARILPSSRPLPVQ